MTTEIKIIGVCLLLVGFVAGCGETAEPTEVAAEAGAAEPESTTTTEATTTTSEPTTTTQPTTTTEPPTPGEAEVTGPRIAGFDTAVGSEAPTVAGYDFLTAEEVAWGGQGEPAAVLFAPLGDWCPHCSTHVEQLTDFAIDYSGPVSTGQVLLVTSSESPSAQHPQDEWLAERSWSYPTVLDSLDIAIGGAFGVSSVPVWYLVGSDGTVVQLLDGHHVSPAEVFAQIEAME